MVIPYSYFMVVMKMSKMSFCSGDKVRCINKNENTNSTLIIGKVYTVIESSPLQDWIKIDGTSMNFVRWTNTQFELYQGEWDV